MGSEFAQSNEWNHESSIQWHLREFSGHREIILLVKDLNNLYKKDKILYLSDFDGNSFRWVDFKDYNNTVISFLRILDNERAILACFNFTPVPRYDYRIGVPLEGIWKEIFNSDAEIYGGSGHGDFGKVVAHKILSHGYEFSVSLTLPPLGALFFKSVRKNID